MQLNQEEKFREWVRANIQRHDEMIVGVLNLLKELRDISLEQNGKQAEKGNGKSVSTRSKTKSVS